MRLGRPLPEALDRVVLCCLAKQPSDRYPDAGALYHALAACGLPEWTDTDARAAAQRVASQHPIDLGTARTLLDAPSQLTVDLQIRKDEPA